jgi:hypothetical protein
MSALAARPARTITRVLGRYTTPEGARTLYGRYEATNRQTRITDESAAIKGDIYLVELCPDGDGADAIDAVVSDYLQTAHRTGQIPMAHTILDADLPVAA